VVSQSLGAVPATPADAAVWKAHGSPAVVHITAPKPADIKLAPGALYGDTIDPEHLFALGDRNVSQTELNALPTDPGGLRAALLERYHGGGGDLPTDRDQWLFSVGSSVLIDLPVSGAVRGAAYRMLAALPGVRSLGVVHDARGRAGQAVAIVLAEPQMGTFEVRLIFDPATGQALASERRAVAPTGRYAWLKPGALSSYELVLAPRPTDANPPAVISNSR
jgi:hypothetical protein